MDKSDLKDAIASTLDWRQRKAAEFPDDNRNVEAVALLSQIEAAVDSLTHTEWEFYGSLLWDADVSAALSEVLKEVGFQRWPKDAMAILSDLFQKLGRRIPA